MNLLRLRCVYALSVVGALALYGCSGDDDTPDAGGMVDTGPGGGGQDATAGQDATTTPDAGRADTGMQMMPDTGVPDMTGEEGYACATGNTCNDATLTCVDLSPSFRDEADRVRICIRECTTDADCTMSTSGSLCRPVEFNATGCVSAEVGEGAQTNLSASAGAITGCELDLLAIPPSVGSGLLALEDYNRSCGRSCHPDSPLNSPTGCDSAYPFCNPQIFNSSTTPGLCTLRRAQPGDTCSRTSVVGLCDTSTTPGGNFPAVLCVGVPIDMVDPDDPSPMPDPGLCFALCDFTPATPTQGLVNDCTHADDPTIGPSVCKQAFSDDQDFGICSSECTAFPDRCSRPGGFNLGTSCTDPLAFDQMLDAFTFCRNVLPPVIDEYDWMNAPQGRCMQEPGGEGRCPANTFCADDNMGGICVRGCSTATTSPGGTGCEVTTVTSTTCDDTLINAPNLGVCVP